MFFLISLNFDENKIFLRTWGEIEERLDPLFYLNMLLLEKNIVQKSSHRVSTFKQIVNMQRGRFGHRPRNDPRYYGGRYPFIQTGNIVKASEANNKIEYSQTLNELGLSTSRLFEEKVLVITIAANIGYTAILDYSACFPDSLVALTAKNNDISIEYLNVYIRLIRQYIENLAPQAAQKNINLKQLSKLPIIVPDIDIQKKIVEIMNEAYTEKTAKEKEAQVLLNSINDYLITELGIVMPEENENTLENRIFYVDFTDALGERFDPYFYTDISMKNKNPISRYETVKFSSIIVHSETGLPVRKDCREEIGQYPYYGANGIIGYMNEFTHDGKYLIMGQDGYIGNHYIVEGRFWASNHNWVIELDSSVCDYDYVKSFLDFWDYSYLITGGVIPKITRAATYSIPIVLPPIGKQQEISDYISKIKTNYKCLIEQAEQIVIKAKSEVQKIMLGGKSL